MFELSWSYHFVNKFSKFLFLATKCCFLRIFSFGISSYAKNITSLFYNVSMNFSPENFLMIT